MVCKTEEKKEIENTEEFLDNIEEVIRNTYNLWGAIHSSTENVVKMEFNVDGLAFEDYHSIVRNIGRLQFMLEALQDYSCRNNEIDALRMIISALFMNITDIEFGNYPNTSFVLDDYVNLSRYDEEHPIHSATYDWVQGGIRELCNLLSKEE